MKEQAGRNQKTVKIVFHCDACNKDVEVTLDETASNVRLDAIDTHYVGEHGAKKKN